MKKLILVVTMLALVGCTSSTEYGKCIGINGKQDPKLEYQYSAWNIFIGLAFATFIFPPVYVAIEEISCPVGNKQ